MTRTTKSRGSGIVIDMGVIESESRDELALRWSTLFSEAIPKNMSTNLLRRAVGHWLQQKSRPGLRKVTQQYLRQVSALSSKAGSIGNVDAPNPDDRKSLPLQQRESRPTFAQPAPEPLASGSRLVREWKGKVYEVNVATDGRYTMNGQVYGSLSEIARLITGTNWSGPRFFGLVKVKSK